MVIRGQNLSVSIPRATLTQMQVANDHTVVCRCVDGSERRIGPFGSDEEAVQGFRKLLQALSSEMSVLDLTPPPNNQSTLPNDMEALKLLSDWSKWSILVQAGMITAIGTFAKPDQIGSLGAWPQGFLLATVVLFAISIIAASFLLKSLPATAQRLPPSPGRDIFHMGTFEGTQGFRVYRVTAVQTYAFILGLLAFVFFVVSVWIKWG
jgi:hypothetical protein